MDSIWPIAVVLVAACVCGWCAGRWLSFPSQASEFISLPTEAGSKAFLNVYFEGCPDSLSLKYRNFPFNAELTKRIVSTFNNESQECVSKNSAANKWRNKVHGWLEKNAGKYNITWDAEHHNGFD